MNHGVSLNQKERGFFPLVEFRDAAMWFAKRGYMVVAPTGTGYGAAALDEPERGLYSLFFSKVGSCDNPNFHDAGRFGGPDRQVDHRIHDRSEADRAGQCHRGRPIGRRLGRHCAVERESAAVRAIITFAAGRGGRVGGKPNNNCAPDRLVAATGEFGRTARTPMLWIYIENDTFFGPALSKRMHEAYTGAGGNAEYHLLPPFGSDGHFLIGSPDSHSVVDAAGRSVPGQARRCRRHDDGGEKMTRQVPPISRPIKLLTALPVLLLLDFGTGAASAQQLRSRKATRQARRLPVRSSRCAASARQERSSIPIGASSASRLLERTWCAGHRSAGHLRRASPPSASI